MTGKGIAACGRGRTGEIQLLTGGGLMGEVLRWFGETGFDLVNAMPKTHA